ncbi:MAG: prepilin-type N-terminal cleavage/methylation domain-containing protein [Patescibacteria group bacterium]
MDNRGFTLIELVIVIGIVGVLTGGMVFYSRSAERQIILFRDQAKIVEALLRAKSLTISTYSDIDASCGYGVSFNEPRKAIIIFKDLAINPDCSDADNQYRFNGVDGDYTCDIGDPALNECVEKLTLDDQTIEFSSLTLRDIVYIPPNPDIMIDNDIAKQSASIEIKTVETTGAAVKKIITITNNGQITTQ